MFYIIILVFFRYLLGVILVVIKVFLELMVELKKLIEINDIIF